MANLLSANASSVETSVVDWFALSRAASIVQSTDQAYIGTHSIKVTRNTQTIPGYICGVNRVTTTASTEYYIELFVYTSVTNAQFRVETDWYQSDNTTYVSTTVGNNITVPANTWTRIKATYSSPALGAKGGILIRIGSGTVNGDIIYVDNAYIGTTTAVSTSDTGSGSESFSDTTTFANTDSTASSNSESINTGATAKTNTDSTAAIETQAGALSTTVTDTFISTEAEAIQQSGVIVVTPTPPGGRTTAFWNRAKYVPEIVQVGKPIFSPVAGTYTNTQSVSIISSGADNIFYTTDGTAPTISDNLYSTPISVASNMTIRAIGLAAALSTSQVGTASYIINSTTVATPTFNIPTGSYSGTQTIILSDATTGAQINYTLDGSTPSTLVSPALPTRVYTGPFSITNNTTVSAVGIKSGLTPSSVATAIYTIIQVSGTLVFSDEFNDVAGTQPDPSKWSADTGAGWDNGNNAAYYTPLNRSGNKNMYQDGAGNLVIEARQEDGYPGAQTFNGHQYTSGRMKAINTFLGGRIEWRAKFDSIQSGVWPALWTYNNGTALTSGYGGNSSELDMLEIFGSNNGNHAEYHNHVCNTNSGTITNDPTNWHVYSLEWQPTTGANKIEYKLDGVTVYSNVSCTTLNTTRLFPIMNVSLTRPGSSLPWNQITSGFVLYRVYVDYIRIYQ